MPTTCGTDAFFHDPKTGCSTVRDAALAMGGEVLGRSHDTHQAWAAAVAGFRLIGSVRDPWTKYAALYRHAMRARRGPMLEVYGSGTTDFKAVLWGMTHLSTRTIPRETGAIWNAGRAEKMAASGVGLATWTHRYVYGDAMHVYLATDRLDEGLATLGYPTPRSNIAPADAFGSDYQAWYDEDMVEWVAIADRALIQRFGFEPWQASPQALYERTT